MNRTENNNQIQQHTIAQSIALHLLPGILILLCYFLFVPLVTNAGYPTLAAFVVAAVLVLIPLELGIIYIGKKKQKATYSEFLVLNRRTFSLKMYVLIIFALVIVMGLLLTILTPLSLYFESRLFGFFSVDYKLDFGMSEGYSKSILIQTYSVGFLVTAILAPMVEEYYFRGYLLPRIPKLKGYNILFHSFFFALYHFWTPWMVLTRMVFMYPFVYVVNKYKNINIGIVSHCFVNTIDFVVGFIFIFSIST